MKTPTARVAANRRLAFVWIPVLLVGLLFIMGGAPMITVFNSLDLLGIVLILAAFLGLAKEVE